MASSLISSIADTLASLSILPSTSSDQATDLKTYAFKPKGSADAPKLVIVLAESSKDIGKASALAKKIGNGVKDLRAAEEDYIKSILGDVENKESSMHALVMHYHIVYANSPFHPFTLFFSLPAMQSPHSP